MSHAHLAENLSIVSAVFWSLQRASWMIFLCRLVKRSLHAVSLVTYLWQDQRTNIVIWSAWALSEWLDFFFIESRSFARIKALGIDGKENQSGFFLCFWIQGLLIMLNAFGKCTVVPVQCGKECYMLIMLGKGKLGSLFIVLIWFARLNPFLRQGRIVSVTKSVQGCVSPLIPLSFSCTHHICLLDCITLSGTLRAPCTASLSFSSHQFGSAPVSRLRCAWRAC